MGNTVIDNFDILLMKKLKYYFQLKINFIDLIS